MDFRPVFDDQDFLLLLFGYELVTVAADDINPFTGCFLFDGGGRPGDPHLCGGAAVGHCALSYFSSFG